MGPLEEIRNAKFKRCQLIGSVWNTRAKLAFQRDVL